MLSKVLSLAAGLAALAEAQKQSLVITNACPTEPLWVAHMANAATGPSPQNLKIPPLGSQSFLTPDNLKATRYWPKYRCDADGNQCKVGGSGGPGETCDTQVGCAPPVDTKFEATFGQTGLPCNTSAGQYDGCDWIDVSMVDGFTVPFKFEVTGKCGGSSGLSIDCSQVDMSDCPVDEMVQGVGALDLRVVHPTTGEAVGCYSPCSKLTLRNWNNEVAMQHIPQDAVAAPYCCPTPPESPEQCRTGPVPNSKWVQMVHAKCPGVYGYAYDDGMGLVTCEAGSTYHVTFYCPSGKPGPTPAPVTGTTTTTEAPAPAQCKVGDKVNCPNYDNVPCAGNQCCPDGSVCPSASNDFHSCLKPKALDCTVAASAEELILF